ncbi:lipase family protein [Leptolyngbya sp. KIOST-1]|uniref:lipase family protein n=1 Tax=Leptolyngbya sp. KIOST-1 TaxID=1229172 RepID=UPI00056BC012|nr:lipase family protein [Leptolyngbya sp. KIOST-1]
MANRRFRLVLGASLYLVLGGGFRAPQAEAALTSALMQEPGWSSAAVAQGLPRRLLRAPVRLVAGLTPALLLASLSLAGGAFIALTWLHIYQQQRRWQRVELARQEVKAFRERPAVRNVLDILDYEEYRTFYISHPEDGRLLTFEAHDERLQRALRPHDEMVRMRRGLNEIKRMAQEQRVKPAALALVQRYEKEEFVIELTLRDWFDSFLGGLEYFEIMIESGLVMAEEIKPFVIHWIRLIGDRRYRRTGGSGFYDQLSHYIHWSGYGRVKALFERYGFKVLPPPYAADDFSAPRSAQYRETNRYDTYRALWLAKAAHLVYEDRDYIADIARLWLSKRVPAWQLPTTPIQKYAVETLKAWQQEGQRTTLGDLRNNYVYLDIRKTNTQAFLFRKDNNIVLSFRGTQQFDDWKTNLKIRLKAFTVGADQESVRPVGRLHRGFLEAWQSVEKQVMYWVKEWNAPTQATVEAGTATMQLWVTGHSLGGALAAVATVALETRGYAVSGLYTFGQPRVADWRLVSYMNGRMGERIFRYVNNNDIVPLIPPQIVPWVPTRVYGHMGQFRYFNDFGTLRRQSFLFQRFPDRLFGVLRAILTSGSPDAIDDHKMEFYVANLQKALVREQEEAKLEIEQSLNAGDFVESMKGRMRARRVPEG